MKQHQRSGSLILEKAAVLAAAGLRQYRLPFFSSLIFGLLAYGYAFTNKLVNHDEVFSLFTKGATVTSGRWGLGALDLIFPNYSMPWIYGIFTIALIAVAVCIIVRIFRLQNPALQVLISGCITVFPSLIGLFGYMFTSTSFALAFLLAVAAAAIIQDLHKWYVLPAVACLVFSLSIYQSYISITASLLVLILIRQLLTEQQPLDVLKKGICFVAFLLISLILYYFCTEVILRLTGNVLNEYASENLAFSFSNVLKGVILAYSSFFRFFTEGFQGLIPTAFSQVIHTFLLAAIFVMLFLLILRSRGKNPGQIILLAVLVAVLPLAANCMYMITTPDSIHTLVLYSFVSVYILAAVPADVLLSGSEGSPASKCIINALTIAMALIILVNTYVANQAYLHLHLRYENAYSFYSTLIADIKTTPGFDENSKLALIGDYQQPEYYSKQFENIHKITGVYGFVPDDYSKRQFLEYYMGFKIPFASSEEIQQIQSSPDFEAMAVYPFYGSLQKIGNILVVKLS